MSDRASAPGKIMLAGEYAVLDGGPAVMIAIDRRAEARWTPQKSEPSPLLAAIAAELARDGLDPDVARSLDVDSSALCGAGGIKLGLGSSAAAAVAATALWLDWPAGLEHIHEVAHRAHRAAQARRGHPGSGADVAASIHGGVIEVRSAPNPDDLPVVRPLTLPPELVLIPVWTGAPADTASLVERVLGEVPAAPGRRTALAAIGDAAENLARACDESDAGAAIAALAAAAAALDELAGATGVPLVSATHRRVARLAEAAGGVAKPTGAGAGDIALAAFAGEAAAARFRHDIEAAGIKCLDLRVDESGVDFAW